MAEQTDNAYEIFVFRPPLNQRLIIPVLGIFVSLIALFSLVNSTSSLISQISAQRWGDAILPLIVLIGSLLFFLWGILCIFGFFETLRVTPEGITLNAIHTHMHVRHQDIEYIGLVHVNHINVPCLIIKRNKPQPKFQKFINMLPDGNIPIANYFPCADDIEVLDLNEILNSSFGQSLLRYAPHLFADVVSDTEKA
jgi:hypothetical protein